MVLRRARPALKKRKPRYEIRWNGERARYEAWAGETMLGFHRFKEGAIAIGERWAKAR